MLSALAINSDQRRKTVKHVLCVVYHWELRESLGIGMGNAGIETGFAVGGWT